MVFGCWTPVSRESALPVFKKDNGILFYPIQYESEESSKNVPTWDRLPIGRRFQETTHMSDEVMRIAAAFWAVRS